MLECWNIGIMGLKAWSMGQGAKSLEKRITLYSTLPACPVKSEGYFTGALSS